VLERRGVITPAQLSIAEEFQAAFFRSRFVQLKSFALVRTSWHLNFRGA